VPTDELAYLEFAVIFDEESRAVSFEQTLTALGLEFEVWYRDMNGEQRSRTKVTMAYDGTRGWGFDEVALYKGEEDSPFATLPRSVTVAPPAAT